MIINTDNTQSKSNLSNVLPITVWNTYPASFTKPWLWFSQENPSGEVVMGHSGAISLTFPSCKLKSNSPAISFKAARRTCVLVTSPPCPEVQSPSWFQSCSSTSPVTSDVWEVFQLPLGQVLFEDGGSRGHSISDWINGSKTSANAHVKAATTVCHGLQGPREALDLVGLRVETSPGGSGGKPHSGHTHSSWKWRCGCRQACEWSLGVTCIAREEVWLKTLTLKILAEKSNIGHRYNSELNGIHVWGPCVSFWTAFSSALHGMSSGSSREASPWKHLFLVYFHQLTWWWKRMHHSSGLTWLH